MINLPAARGSIRDANVMSVLREQHLSAEWTLPTISTASYCKDKDGLLKSVPVGGLTVDGYIMTYDGGDTVNHGYGIAGLKYETTGVASSTLKGYSAAEGTTNRFIDPKMPGAWAKSGTLPPTVTDNNDIGPDGTNSMATVTGLNLETVASLISKSTGHPVSSPVNMAYWFKKSTATGTVIFRHWAGGSSFGRWSLDLSLLSTGLELLTASHPAITVINPYTSDSSGRSGSQIFSTTGDVNFSIGWAHITDNVLTRYCDGFRGDSRGLSFNPPVPSTFSIKAVISFDHDVYTSAKSRQIINKGLDDIVALQSGTNTFRCFTTGDDTATVNYTWVKDALVTIKARFNSVTGKKQFSVAGNLSSEVTYTSIASGAIELLKTVEKYVTIKKLVIYPTDKGAGWL